MPCDAFSAIATATESLPTELYGRLSPTVLWPNLIPRKEYKKNMGLEQTSYQLGNIEPTDTPTWMAETLISDENVEGACANTDDTVSWGYDSRTYGPEKYQVRGPLLCKEQFTYNWEPDKFMDGYLKRLAMYSARVESNRLQEHYISNSYKFFCGPNIIVPGTALTPGQAEATIPAVNATSELTQSQLNKVAYKLIDLGAADQEDPTSFGYFGYGKSGPLFTLMIDPEASEKITNNDPKVVTELNFSDMGMGAGATLRRRLAVAIEYRSFKHLISTTLPRYNWTGTGYDRVPVYVNVATTGEGVKSDINPDWQTADIGVAIVIHPLVMDEQIVAPDDNPAGLPFTPSNYVGEWRFVVGGYKLGLDCDDPLDKFGQHFAEWKHAIEPINQDYGYTFFYRRCNDDAYNVACS